MSDESLVPTERPRHWRLLDRLIDGGGAVIFFLVLWAAFGLFLVLIHGLIPRSFSGWLLYVFLAPLVWIAGEVLLEGFQAIPPIKRARNTIRRRAHQHWLSGTRIVYLLIEFIVFLALFFTIIWLLGLLGVVLR